MTISTTGSLRTTSRLTDPMPEYVRSTVLGDVSIVRHGFFGRGGGVSTSEYASLNCSPGSGDDPDAIHENRHRVAAALGGRCLVTNQQVHGNRVRIVDDGSDLTRSIEADGLVTRMPGVCLGALGADCAPVIFADPVAGVIGVAHAGWQGALCGVTDSVIDALIRLGATEANIVAAIGPAIQCPSYEVGEAFRTRFEDESPVDGNSLFSRSATTGNVHFDLPGYIRLRLKARQLAVVDQLHQDTYTDEPGFFSYRRACHRGEERYGRQVGAVCLV